MTLNLVSPFIYSTKIRLDNKYRTFCRRRADIKIVYLYEKDLARNVARWSPPPSLAPAG